MASLGFRTIDEMVGRAERARRRQARSATGRRRGLDFSRVLAAPAAPERDGALRCTSKQLHDFSLSLDPELIAQSQKALDKKEPVSLFASIRNCNRTVGATLSAEVSKRYGSKGLPAGHDQM